MLGGTDLGQGRCNAKGEAVRYRFTIDHGGIISDASEDTLRTFGLKVGERFGHCTLVEEWRNVAGRRMLEEAMDTRRIITGEDNGPFIFIPGRHGALLLGEFPDWMARLLEARHFREGLQARLLGLGLPHERLHWELRQAIEQASPWRHPRGVPRLP